MMELTIRGDFTEPEGYEFTGELRRAVAGEHYLCDAGQARHTDMRTAGRYLILRPKWKPPTWLKEGTWIAQHATGLWVATNSEPVQIGSGWTWRGYGVCIEASVVDWNPPPCTDWRESKRQIRHG